MTVLCGCLLHAHHMMTRDTKALPGWDISKRAMSTHVLGCIHSLLVIVGANGSNVPGESSIANQVTLRKSDSS